MVFRSGETVCKCMLRKRNAYSVFRPEISHSAIVHITDLVGHNLGLGYGLGAWLRFLLGLGLV